MNEWSVFIPESHQGCAIENFDWVGKDALKKEVILLLEEKRDKGLILIGEPGVGKTHICVGLFKQQVDKGKTIGIDTMYLDWSKFVQECYVDMSLGVQPELKVSRVSQVKLLLLDDIRPFEKGELWKILLRQLIEEASLGVKNWVFSTNANSVEELFSRWKLEDYWISRLCSRFTVVVVKGKDRRIAQ